MFVVVFSVNTCHLGCGEVALCARCACAVYSKVGYTCRLVAFPISMRALLPPEYRCGLHTSHLVSINYILHNKMGSPDQNPTPNEDKLV